MLSLIIYRDQYALLDRRCQKFCLFKAYSESFRKSGSRKLRAPQTTSPWVGFLSTFLNVLHTDSAWHLTFVGSNRSVMTIKLSGRSRRLLHPCSCEHAFFCFTPADLASLLAPLWELEPCIAVSDFCSYAVCTKQYIRVHGVTG